MAGGARALPRSWSARGLVAGGTGGARGLVAGGTGGARGLVAGEAGD